MNIKFLITYLTVTSLAYSQDFSIKELPLQISYYGENGFHPGIKLGTYHNFKSFTDIKPRKWKKRQAKFGDKTKYKNYFSNVNIGMYSHPNNHKGVFLNVGIGFERSKKRKGNMIGHSLEMGYLKRFNKFSTYELDSNGDIKKVFGAGSNAVVFTYYFLIGRDLSVKRGIPLKWYIKPGLQCLTYNHAWFPNAVLDLGIVINLKTNKK